MRYYRFVGIAVVVTAFVLFATCSFAQDAQPRCVPLPEVAKDIKDHDIPPSALSKLLGDDLAQKYIQAAGIEIKGETDPIGVFFVTVKDIVFTFLVERQGCVRWAIQVPQVQHEKAMNKLASSI